jgi:cyclic pyranopterin phosphate synthase
MDDLVLSHLDEKGRAQMVDVTLKEPSVREAVAHAKVVMSPQTLALIQEGSIPKGDVFSVARIAGVMAAKKTGELIPMCHPLELTHIAIHFSIDEAKGEILIDGQARLVGKTGVEMEALTAVTVAGLTIYDMCKAVDKNMIMTDVMLVKKSGGKSGIFERKTEP